MADDDHKVDESRRNFLKKSGYAAGGVVGGGVIGSLIGVNWGDTNEETKQTKNTQTGDDEKSVNRALMYFTSQKDFNTISAATERIFPEDDNGPGAIELGVPYFIDHQLAGAYGHNSQEYMHGPFHPGSDFQGYQSRLKRHEIFTQAIKLMEQKSQQDHDTPFKDLDGDKQDDILVQFQDNKIKMRGVKASEFFTLLHEATLAGAYSDPLYGGNVNMEGWKMKEFPGNVMSYTDEIESDSFVEMKPTPLSKHQ